MARANLSAMLGRLDEAVTPPKPSEAPVSEETKASEATPKASGRRSSVGERSRPGEVEASAPRGYRSFERKETRLRADQYERLTQEARRLNRAKTTPGERITENTLIRVAIDLLFERADQLHGENEEELRESVSL